jgi:hypothetical protein
MWACRHAFAALLAALPAPPAPETPADAVPFELGPGGSVAVRVRLNGGGDVPFLLDTGATGTSVFEPLVAALGLRPVARRLVVTSVGRETRTVVRLGRVTVGAADREGLLATVVPTPETALTGAGVQGILGQDFLSSFNYTLDYRRRRLSWDASGTDGVRLPLRPSEGRLLVGLPQPGRDVVWLVPDTGTSGLVVFERPGRPRLPTEELPGAAYEVESLSGARRRVDARRVKHLHFGGFTLRDLVAAVVPRPEADAPEGDGLLPLHIFARVTFACRDGYLLLQRR